MTKARDIADGVDTADIADGAISTAKLADSAITDAKLATGISASKLSGALPAISGAALTGISAGYTYLGSVTTTSGNSQTLSSLDLSSYTFLKCVYNEVQANNTAIPTLNGHRISNYNVSTNNCSGFTVVELSTGIYESQINSGSNGTDYFNVTPTNGKIASAALSPSTTSLTFAFTSSAVGFQNGSIKVYGI